MKKLYKQISTPIIWKELNFVLNLDTFKNCDLIGYEDILSWLIKVFQNDHMTMWISLPVDPQLRVIKAWSAVGYRQWPFGATLGLI